eukprot:Rhum_TRINITY_DN14909_c7_g1::Rhum_TRINITY_DN14909_c7_g1_i1::g.127532::m.127532
MGYTTLCLAAGALLSLAGCGVEAKGTGYRSSRGGSYSRAGAYGYGSMWLWHGGYRGHRTSTSSGINAATLNTTGTEIYCKRQVHLDKGYAADTVGNRIALNSTRYCEKRVTPVDGAVENTPIKDIFLDVYEFQFEAGQGKAPSVLMQQYDDVDSTHVAAASPIQVLLTKLIEYRSDTTTIAKVINTRDLTWEAYRAAPNKPVFGYPSSYFKDQSRIVTLAIRGTNPPANTIDLTIAFSLSEDYAEDTFGDHLFMRPSGLEMHVTLRKYEFETPISGATPNTLGLELGLVTVGNPSMYHMTPAPVTKYGTEYDPRARNRIEVGQLQDTDTRGRHYFSWAANMNKMGFCLDATAQEPGCARFSYLTDACAAGTTGATIDCAALGVPAGRQVTQMLFRASKVTGTSFGAYDPLQVNNQYPRPKQGDLISWSTTLGTWDYAETMAPRTGAASALTASVGLSVVSVLALLLALL